MRCAALICEWDIVYPVYILHIHTYTAANSTLIPENTSKFHNQVVQMSMAHTLAVLLLARPEFVSHGAFPMAT